MTRIRTAAAVTEQPALWNHLCYLKEKYDPQHLLSTGVNIFEAINLKNEHRLANF